MAQKSYLLDLICQFFESEWPHVEEDDVDVRKIVDGMVNTVIVVSRPLDSAQTEPHQLVVRLYGGAMVPISNFSEFSKLSESEELLVFNEMSASGWGPQLLGVFAGGRLEEYVPSHTLTPTESQDPDIRRDIAISYARFHSLKPPLKKNKFTLLVREFLEAVNYDVGTHRAKCQKISDTGSIYAAEAIEHMPAHNRELEWAHGLFSRYECRRTYINLDCNFLNILVREHPIPNQQRVVLVDYELSTYAYRGIDIGAHFINRMIRWQNKVDKVSGHLFPDTSERRTFCRQYLDEYTELGQTADQDIDSLDHLVLEAEVGALFYACYMSCVLYRYMDLFLQDTAFISAIKSLNCSYADLKTKFLVKHPEARH